MTDNEFIKLKKMVEETIASGNKLVNQAQKLVNERANVLREWQEVAAARSRGNTALDESVVWAMAKKSKLVPEDFDIDEVVPANKDRTPRNTTETKPRIAKILARRGRV